MHNYVTDPVRFAEIREHVNGVDGFRAAEEDRDWLFAEVERLADALSKSDTAARDASGDDPIDVRNLISSHGLRCRHLVAPELCPVLEFAAGKLEDAINRHRTNLPVSVLVALAYTKGVLDSLAACLSAEDTDD